MTRINKNLGKTNAKRQILILLPHGSRFSRGTSLKTRHGASFFILILVLREISSTILGTILTSSPFDTYAYSKKEQESRYSITLEIFGVALHKTTITRECPSRLTIVNRLIRVITMIPSFNYLNIPHWQHDTTRKACLRVRDEIGKDTWQKRRLPFCLLAGDCFG